MRGWVSVGSGALFGGSHGPLEEIASFRSHRGASGVILDCHDLPAGPEYRTTFRKYFTAYIRSDSALRGQEKQRQEEQQQRRRRKMNKKEDNYEQEEQLRQISFCLLFPLRLSACSPSSLPASPNVRRPRSGRDLTRSLSPCASPRGTSGVLGGLCGLGCFWGSGALSGVPRDQMLSSCDRGLLGASGSLAIRRESTGRKRLPDGLS